MVKIHRTDSERWTRLCHLHAPNLPDDRESKQGGEKRKARKSRGKKNGRAIFVRRLGQPVAVAVAQDLKGSCDWSERIRQCGNAAVPQKDNH